MMVNNEIETRATGWSPEPFLGRTFDGYRVESMIGHGGMGAIYLATQLSLGRSVALKVISQGLLQDPQLIERFHREADALGRLSHPNIVTVIDRGEVDNRPYLVMEYVDGTNLRQVMREGPLASGEALKVVSSVLSALEHAHGQGIVHRDIKPENVLLAKGGVVKVADFGLSRLLGPDANTRLTRTNIALGTYEYMAPEQRERAREADERSDLYATGVVLYELLTGELPIGRFPLPSKRRPDECDSQIDGLIEKSLEKDPEERFQTAREMGDAVSVVLERAPGQPSAGTPSPAPSPAAAGANPIDTAARDSAEAARRVSFARASAMRLEHHLSNLVAINRVIGGLLLLCGLGWFLIGMVSGPLSGRYASSASWAVVVFFGIGALWFIFGGLFCWTGNRLRKHVASAPGVQHLLAIVAGLTGVLLPYTIYSFWVLSGHRGRIYYQARSEGATGEQAAARADDILGPDRAGGMDQVDAPRALEEMQSAAAELPSDFRPVRMEHRFRTLGAANAIIGILLGLGTIIWMVAFPLSINYVNSDGRVELGHPWWDSAQNYFARQPDMMVRMFAAWFGGLALAWLALSLRTGLTRYRSWAPGAQLVLAIPAALSGLLFPYAIYALQLTFGLKGRTYFDARSAGLPPGEAAVHTYRLLEGDGQSSLPDVRARRRNHGMMVRLGIAVAFLLGLGTLLIVLKTSRQQPTTRALPTPPIRPALTWFHPLAPHVIAKATGTNTLGDSAAPTIETLIGDSGAQDWLLRQGSLWPSFPQGVITRRKGNLLVLQATRQPRMPKESFQTKADRDRFLMALGHLAQVRSDGRWVNVFLVPAYQRERWKKDAPPPAPVKPAAEDGANK
ncbi:MAG: serine/threonine-protein kinase [Planctomycetota bacterium]